MITVRNPLGDDQAVSDLATWCSDAARLLSDVGRDTASAFVGLSDDFIADVATKLFERIVVRRDSLTRSPWGYVDRLHRLGTVIEAHAEWMRNTWAEVKATKPRIEAWMAAEPDHPLRPVVLPPEPHDTDSVLAWRDLAADLRRAGVVL